MPALLLLLICIPILANRAAARLAGDHVWSITGLSLGAVISPVSIGLYAVGFYLPPVGLVLTLPGLVLSMIHEAPGFNIATYFGIRPAGQIVGGTTGIGIELINGMVWGLCYSLAGFVFDSWRRVMRARRMSA